MKITCNVIKDLAELYVGGALSEDSNRIVEEHIVQCPKCKGYIEKSKEVYEATISEDCIEIAEEKASFKTLRERIIAKILPVVIITTFAVCTSIAIMDYALFEHEIVTPYDAERIYVTEEGLLHFPGELNVSFTVTSSGNIRVQTYTNYISKIKGVESADEEIVDLKEITGESKCKIYYKDGVKEHLIWQVE